MSKRKLLLADDSVTIQKVVNLTFADEGIEVISVGDGDSAIEKIAEISPDLIMADVHMPGLSGYEICEQIRSDESLRHIPVILLVGSFEPFDEEEAKRVGADDYLTKPFQSIRQLVNKVTALLNSSVSEDQKETADLPSFSDTLEITSPGSVDLPPISHAAAYKAEEPEYDISVTDDEMIETSQAPVEPIDSEVEELNDAAMEADFNAEDDEEIPTNEDTPKRITDDDEIADEVYSESNAADETASVYETIPEDEDDSDKGFAVVPIANNYSIEEDSLEESVSNVPERITDEDEAADVASSESDTADESASVYDTIPENDEDSTKEFAEVPAEHNDPEEENSAELETTDSHELDESELLEDVGQSEELTQDEDLPLPEAASILQIDEDNLLELPPIEQDYEDEEYAEGVGNAAAASAAVGSAAGFAMVGSSSTNSQAEPGDGKTNNLSNDLIEEIVQKVIARLSDTAVKEIAWEVVPPMTELIVKKMAEEKLKD